MTSLPTRFVVGPEMSDFGLSMASVALAKGAQDTKCALDGLWASLCELGASFELLRKNSEGDKRLGPEMPTDEVRLLLETGTKAEKICVEGQQKLRLLLMRPRIQRVISRQDKYSVEDFWKFLEIWSRDYTPLLRKLRLSVIMGVFDKLLAKGILSDPLPDGFAESFLTMPLDETEGWTETAFILANENNALIFSRSLEEEAMDRTDALGLV